MLLVAPLQETLRVNGEREPPAGVFGRLKERRSTLPAITHVDYSARIQTVSAATNPRFYELLNAFERRTGCPVLVNTSFNVRGEPPVCTPEEAYRCFSRTDMDYLALGNFLVEKTAIPREASTSGAFQTAGLSQSVVLRAPVSVLRHFGLTIGSAFAVLGALALWRHRGAGWVFVIAAGLSILLGALVPKTLRYVYEAWMAVARILSWFTTRLLLTLVFFLGVTPLGLLQRLFGKRPIDLRFRSDDATYWTQRPAEPKPADYEKQF
jgi:hypothetical protein